MLDVRRVSGIASHDILQGDAASRARSSVTETIENGNPFFLSFLLSFFVFFFGFLFVVNEIWVAGSRDVTNPLVVRDVSRFRR